METGHGNSHGSKNGSEGILDAAEHVLEAGVDVEAITTGHGSTMDVMADASAEMGNAIADEVKNAITPLVGADSAGASSGGHAHSAGAH